jgi:hypothetical protein
MEVSKLAHEMKVLVQEAEIMKQGSNKISRPIDRGPTTALWKNHHSCMRSTSRLNERNNFKSNFVI